MEADPVPSNGIGVQSIVMTGIDDTLFRDTKDLGSYDM